MIDPRLIAVFVLGAMLASCMSYVVRPYHSVLCCTEVSHDSRRQ